MNGVSNTTFVGVPHRGISKEQVQKAKQSVKENSTEMAVGGTVGAATFQTLRNGSRVGNSITRLIQETKLIKASNKAKILKIFEKGRFLNHPVVKKVAGPLAGFAALSTVVGSAAKIADTCQYIKTTKQV